MGIWAPDDWEPPDGEALVRGLAEHARRVAGSNRERAAAIVAGADLEEALGELLTGFIVAGAKSDGLLTGSGLRSFYLRIDLAYALGLVSEDERVDLHIVRSVRNHFAHEKECSFVDRRVVELCANLRVPLHRPPLFADMSTYDRFLSVAFVLAQNLQDRAVSARSSRRRVPEEVDPERWRDFF